MMHKEDTAAAVSRFEKELYQEPSKL